MLKSTKAMIAMAIVSVFALLAFYAKRTEYMAMQEQVTSADQAPAVVPVEEAKPEEPALQPAVEEKPPVEQQSAAPVIVIPTSAVPAKDEFEELKDQMKQRKVTGNGDNVRLEPTTLERFVKLEQAWGEQLEVMWAFRTVSINNEMGGRKHSQHLQGKAIDVVHNGWSKEKMRKFVRLAYDMGFRGFGLGRTIVHIDTRPKLGAWDYPGNPYGSARTMLRGK